MSTNRGAVTRPIAVLVVVSVLGSGPNVAADTAVGDEVIAGLNRLAAMQQHLQFELRTGIRSSGSSAGVQEFDVAVDGERRIVVHSRSGPDARVTCRRGGESFVLLKPSSDADWQLAGAAKSIAGVDDYMTTWGLSSSRQMYQVVGWDLRDVFAGKGFTVDSVEPARMNETVGRVTVTFHRNADTQIPATAGPLDRARVTLAREYSWAIVSRTVYRVAAGTESESEQQYRLDSEGRPCLVAIKTTLKGSDGSSSVGSQEFSDFRYGPVPDEMFSLTRFGIPEFEFPDTYADAAWKGWILFGILGIAAVVLIVIVRSRRRKADST